MDPRDHHRFAVDTRAICRINGRKHGIELYNLSFGGCMIEFGSPVARAGERIEVNLAGIETVSGVVAWVHGPNAGVAFDFEISRNVIERLGFFPSTSPFSEIKAQDRAGQTFNCGPGGLSLDDDDPDTILDTIGENAQIIDTGLTDGEEAQASGGSADRRKHQRVMVDAEAWLSVSLKGGVTGRLFDISTHGCCLDLPEGFFHPGDRVWFRVDPIQPWRGLVRWVDGDMLGVEFERPLYLSVMEMVVQSGKQVECSMAA